MTSSVDSSRNWYGHCLPTLTSMITLPASHLQSFPASRSYGGISLSHCPQGLTALCHYGSVPLWADRSVPHHVRNFHQLASLKGLPNLPDQPEPFYGEEMRKALGHLGVHLAGKDSKIKKYWKDETCNEILVPLSEATAYSLDASPSPKQMKKDADCSSPGYSAWLIPTPTSAETLLYEPGSLNASPIISTL